MRYTLLTEIVGKSEVGAGETSETLDSPGLQTSATMSHLSRGAGRELNMQISGPCLQRF